MIKQTWILEPLEIFLEIRVETESRLIQFRRMHVDWALTR